MSTQWNIISLAISLGLMVFFGYWLYEIYVVRPAAMDQIDKEAEEEINQIEKENMCLRGEPFFTEGQWQCIDNSDLYDYKDTNNQLNLN